jgi:hypothetical protein
MDTALRTTNFMKRSVCPKCFPSFYCSASHIRLHAASWWPAWSRFRRCWSRAPPLGDGSPLSRTADMWPKFLRVQGKLSGELFLCRNFQQWQILPLGEPVHQVTNCRQQGLSWEADSHPAGQDISRIVRNLKINNRIRKSSPWTPIWSEMHTAHNLTPHFSNI